MKKIRERLSYTVVLEGFGFVEQASTTSIIKAHQKRGICVYVTVVKIAEAEGFCN